MKNPLVSVIVPCYNQAIYLPEALQSVLDQDYPHWECIIVNDGSPDNTDEVAKEWTEKDKRFKYFHKENGGLSDTRNYGIEKATGTYILPLDADDRISANYIKEALKVFETNPQTKLVYSNLVLFGNQNKKLTTSGFQYEKLLTENQIFCSGIFQKNDFLQTSGYNTNMKGGYEDWDFWLSLLKPDDIVVKLDEFHFFYRIKDESMRISIEHEKNERLILQIFKNHIPLFLEYLNPIRDRIDADTYKKELRWHYNTKEYKLGRILFSPYNGLKKLYHSLFSKKG